MTYDRRTPRALCSGAELELVPASFAADPAGSSPARLKSSIARARRLRDKYRDLLRRQRLATRARTGSKLGARPGANARTAQKVRLFEETLARFTQQLHKLETVARKIARAKRPAARGAAPKIAAPKAQARGPKQPRRPPVVPHTGFVSERARQASRRQRLQNLRAKSVQAHVRAQGRRNQARRDARSR
jgi:hypothetical protein